MFVDLLVQLVVSCWLSAMDDCMTRMMPFRFLFVKSQTSSDFPSHDVSFKGVKSGKKEEKTWDGVLILVFDPLNNNCEKSYSSNVKLKTEIFRWLSG